MNDGDNSELGESFEHAVASYSNAQELVRFLDTKAAAIIGYSTLLAAIPFGLFHWAFSGADSGPREEITRWMLTMPIGQSVLGSLLVCSLLCAAPVILHALAASSARAQTHYTNQTVLFPAHDDNDKVNFEAAIKKLTAGLSKSVRLSEYAAQITEVGRILRQKMLCIGKALFWLKLQLSMLVVFVVLALLQIIAQIYSSQA